MEGEINPEKIGPVAQSFMNIRNAANPSLGDVTMPGPILDGPLSAGVGTKHNEMSQHAVTFILDMEDGMFDTGNVLVQLLAQFRETDLNSAAAMNKLLSEPRFTAVPGPGGGI